MRQIACREQVMTLGLTIDRRQFVMLGWICAVLENPHKTQELKMPKTLAPLAAPASVRNVQFSTLAAASPAV